MASARHGEGPGLADTLFKGRRKYVSIYTGFIPKFECSYTIKTKIFQKNIKHVYMQKMGSGPEICNLPSINPTYKNICSRNPSRFFFSLFSCGTNFGLYHLDGKEIKYVELIYKSYQSLLFSYIEEVNDHFLFTFNVCLP